MYRKYSANYHYVLNHCIYVQKVQRKLTLLKHCFYVKEVQRKLSLYTQTFFLCTGGATAQTITMYSGHQDHGVNKSKLKSGDGQKI